MASELDPTPEKKPKSVNDSSHVSRRNARKPGGKVDNGYQQRWVSLQREKDFAETVIHAAEAIVLVLDLHGRIMHFNGIMEDITGYRLEEVQGEDWFSIFPPESDAARIRDLFLRSQRGIPVHETMTPIVTFDGKTHYIDWSMKSLKNEKAESVGILMVGRDITQRLLAEQRMQESLKEKEVLLREVCHRTRNTMQIISGLTSLQCAAIEDAEVLRLFRRTDNRIKSLALVHQMLYQSESVCEIDLKPCLEEMIRTLVDAFDECSSRIEIRAELESTLVSIDTAIPCGLILNEALSNCLEYAFPGKAKGTVEITLSTRNRQRNVLLRVRDNGMGVAPEKSGEEADSLGMRLMRQLAELQLGGRLSIESKKGTDIRLEFKNVKSP